MAAGLLFPGQGMRAAESATVPEGYVTLAIAAGTGSAKKTTAVSVPLNNSILSSGQISNFTTNTIVSLSAGWTEGELSAPSSPCLIKITSGAAAGRTFLISTATANTSTTLTIDAKDAAQVDLTTLGIASGDSYEIYGCDTLLSLFGTPATTGVLGGTSANYADSLVIYTNGLSETFYYNTTLNRWTKSALGNPDASNAPIRPDAGVLYSRLAASDLVTVIAGRVATTGRIASVKNSGVTVLAHNWPVDTTLLDSKINLIPTWTANVSDTAADKVKVYANGAIVTYWFDGTHWRKQVAGSPISDDLVIPAGSAVTLDKIGSQSGYTALSQPLPYTLN